MYDLLVIGGGPGGATCARRAALEGLDVALIEKKAHPRQKTCGGALSPKAISLLDFDISQVVENEFNMAIIHRPSGQRTILTREGFRGQLIQRVQFDEYLINKAREAGVDIIEDTEVIAIEQLRKGIRVLGRGDSFKGHLLVGADGVNGISMKQLGIRNQWAQDDVAVCIQAEVILDNNEMKRIVLQEDATKQTAIDLYYGLVEWGYAWCFPLGNRLNVGIGCRLDRARFLRDGWIAFCSLIAKEKRINMKIDQQNSARVPLGGTKQRHIGRRSMLVGDAAGFVSPVTCEGISYAIESGILAAEVAIESVRNKSPTHIIEYERRLSSTITKELDDLRIIARILNKSDANIELICKIADDDPLMKEYLIDLVARVNTLSNLKSKIVKRLLTHHPLKAIRLGL